MNTPVTEAIAKAEGVGEVGNAEYFEDAELVKEAEYYQYSPLGGDCIRLVEVLPTEDESIQCELHVCSLNALSTRKGAPYIALSYTWGPWRDRRQITINGKLMYVRNHLWLALQAIKTLKARAKNSRNVSYVWLSLPELAKSISLVQEDSKRVRIRISHLG